MATCDLFIYTPVKGGSIRVPVARDEEFIERAVLLCEEFFFNCYLYALVEEKKKTISQTPPEVVRETVQFEVTSRISNSALLMPGF